MSTSAEVPPGCYSYRLGLLGFGIGAFFALFGGGAIFKD
jgi:hypothetical protein